MNLTQLRKAPPGTTISDKGSPSSVRGLEARVLPSGKICFYFYYRNRMGVRRRPKIGELGEITLASARRIAKGMLEKVSGGRDIKGEWDAARLEPTVSDAFDILWANYWNTPRFQKSGWAGRVRWYWDNCLADHFGEMRLTSVSTADINAWVALRKNESRYNTNRALEVLSKIYGGAVSNGLAKSNPCTGVTRFTERKRTKYATEEDLRKIGALLDREKEKHPTAVAFIYLMVFTGSRPRALERAEWKDFQRFEAEGQPFGVLTFDGKTTEETGEKEVVVFPPLAMKIVDQLPKREDGKILGRKFPIKLWHRIRKQAGCEGLWGRDLRRTFATIGFSSGVDRHILGELQNHRDSNTMRRYQKLMQGPRFQASVAVSEKAKKLLGESK